jgi:hypothetical protein
MCALKLCELPDKKLEQGKLLNRNEREQIIF